MSVNGLNIRVSKFCTGRLSWVTGSDVEATVTAGIKRQPKSVTSGILPKESVFEIRKPISRLSDVTAGIGRVIPAGAPPTVTAVVRDLNISTFIV